MVDLDRKNQKISIWKHVVSPFSHCSLPPGKVSSDWTRPRRTRTRQPMAVRQAESSGQDQLLLRSRKRMRRQNLNVPFRVVSRGEETQTRTFGRTFPRDSRGKFRLAVLYGIMCVRVAECGSESVCPRVQMANFFLFLIYLKRLLSTLN
jgi:hypothetical protein